MLRILLLIAALTLSAGAVNAANEMTLVENGIPKAVIVLEKKPTRSAQMGALELRHHIKLITGAELQIAEKPLPDMISIRIGGGDQNSSGENIRIKFQKDSIEISGKDSPDFTKVDYGRSATYPSAQQAYNGSLYAVYDFLDDYCGVHFYYPDDTGTTYRERKTLTVPVKDRTHTPPMDAFRWMYPDDRKYISSISGRELALWQLRWRFSNFFGMTNHNQYSIYFTHWDKAKNPNLAKSFKGKRKELFAKGFDGKFHSADALLRSNYPEDADLPPQLCYSNADTVKYYAQEVLTYFRGGNVRGGWNNFYGKYPETRTILHRFRGKPFFYPIQGGDTGGHCLCGECQKRFPGDSKNDVSNNKFQFIADVAREAAKTDPAAGVSTLAYIQTLRYPDKVNLPENVSVQICLPFYSWWHPAVYKKQLEAYKIWVDKEAKRRPLTLWTYLFGPNWDARFHFSNYKPFPGLYPHHTAEIMKMFAKDGIRGWFSEVELRYHVLEAYVAAKIAYDPACNPEKIIADYYNDCYGEAGPMIREFYEEIEKAYWNPENCPAEWLKNPDKVVGPKGEKHPYWTTGLHSPDLNWSLGTPERMKKLASLIQEAKNKVKTENEKIRLQRLIDFIWKPAQEGCEEYRRLKLRRDKPAPVCVIPATAPAKGEPDKIDWSKGVSAQSWSDLMGNPVNSGCSAKVAADREYLYIRLQDSDYTDDGQRDIWRNDFEIIFSTDGQYPIYQLAVSPYGQKLAYRHERINDSNKVTVWNADVKIVSHTKGKVWELLAAIPLKSLPVKNNTLKADFFRSSAKGLFCWSPTYSAFTSGTECYGTLVLLPCCVQENKFMCGAGSRIVQDTAADNGRAACMPGNKSWTVQCHNTGMPAAAYRIRVRVRTDAPPKENLKCNIGIYDKKTKKTVLNKPVFAKDISGKKYHEVTIGSCDWTGDRFLYLGGFNDKMETSGIYLDSIILDME